MVSDFALYIKNDPYISMVETKKPFFEEIHLENGVLVLLEDLGAAMQQGSTVRLDPICVAVLSFI